MGTDYYVNAYLGIRFSEEDLITLLWKLPKELLQEIEKKIPEIVGKGQIKVFFEDGDPDYGYEYQDERIPFLSKFLEESFLKIGDYYLDQRGEEYFLILKSMEFDLQEEKKYFILPGDQEVLNFKNFCKKLGMKKIYDETYGLLFISSLD